MKAPPIRLLEQHYTRIAVETVHEHNPDEGPGWKLETTISLRQNPEQDRLWAILLEVALGQEEGRPRIPYEIAARATGAFEVHPGIPADEVPKLVANNGASILYSGLRDFIATITARGPWGQFLLPTVSFVDLVHEKPEDDDQAGEAP